MLHLITLWINPLIWFIIQEWEHGKQLGSCKRSPAWRTGRIPDLCAAVAKPDRVGRECVDRHCVCVLCHIAQARGFQPVWWRVRRRKGTGQRLSTVLHSDRSCKIHLVPVWFCAPWHALLYAYLGIFVTDVSIWWELTFLCICFFRKLGRSSWTCTTRTNLYQ